MACRSGASRRQRRIEKDDRVGDSVGGRVLNTASSQRTLGCLLSQCAYFHLDLVGEMLRFYGFSMGDASILWIFESGNLSILLDVLHSTYCQYGGEDTRRGQLPHQCITAWLDDR